MKIHTRTKLIGEDSIAEEARALMSATAEMVGENVGEIRRRLATALESGGEMVDEIEGKVIKGARETDKAVHLYPYQAIGIAAGIGLIIGCWAARSGNGGK